MSPTQELTMSTPLVSSPDIPTLGDLLDRLGGVPAERVRYYPLPGTATEQDVIDIEARENRLCELVDGVLVEKPMGFSESYLAGLIITLLNQFVLPRDLGIVTGEGGMMRLFAGLVRIPDVAFVSTARLPSGKLPDKPIPSLAPDLAIEVLSESNTKKEMQRKRGEYFKAGVQLIWIVDHRPRTITVYTPSAEPVILHEGQTLDGGSVLPGFTLDLTLLFAKLPR
jgi:Uma2 family endonuclease